MSRMVMVLLASLCLGCSSLAAAHVHAHHPDSSNMRKLLSTPTKPSSSSPQTCCKCKCVVPSKDLRSPECKAKPGCVGMGAPTYREKQICQPGANLNCDSVCLRDMGSWKSYYEC